MYNLPTDSSINGLSIYHEGNHTNKGNPHDNYISKFSCNYSLNNKSIVDKMFKLCTIKYPVNNNVAYKYIIELFATNIENENKIYLSCGNNLDNILCSFKGDSNINIYLKTRLNNNVITIDIYGQLKQTWTKLFYRLYFGRCLDYLLLFDEESAYKYIEFYNESDFIDLSPSDISINYERNEIIKKVITETTTVKGSSDSKISLNVPGLLKNSIVTLMPTNAEIPSELDLISYTVPYNNYIVIRFKNNATYSKDLPELTWNVSYKNLE